MEEVEDTGETEEIGEIGEVEEVGETEEKEEEEETDTPPPAPYPGAGHNLTRCVPSRGTVAVSAACVTPSRNCPPQPVLSCSRGER